MKNFFAKEQKGGTYGLLPQLMDEAEYKGNDFLICGLPYDYRAHVRAGGRKGPGYVRENSCLPRFSLDTGTDLLPLKGADAGDIMATPGDDQQSFDEMKKKVAAILSADAIPVILGGDHSTTYQAMISFKEKFGPAALIYISGHSALQHLDAYPDSSSVLYNMMKDGLIDVAHSVQIGTRDLLSEGYAYAESSDGKYTQDGLRVISTYELRDKGVEALVSEVKAITGDMPVYLSFAPDFADPAFAPAVIDPVSDGFTSFQTLTFLAALLKAVSPAAYDICDLSPVYDEGRITQVFAGDVVNTFIAAIAAKKAAAKEEAAKEEAAKGDATRR